MEVVRERKRIRSEVKRREEEEVERIRKEEEDKRREEEKVLEVREEGNVYMLLKAEGGFAG